MSQKAQKRKSTWFVAKKCTWQCKILSMLQVAAQTDILDFNLKYFPSLFCYLEQRTVRNSRGPFPSMFSLMKWQVFVTQISQIFAIISDGSWTSVHSGLDFWATPIKLSKFSYLFKIFRWNYYTFLISLIVSEIQNFFFIPWSI